MRRTVRLIIGAQDFIAPAPKWLQLIAVVSSVAAMSSDLSYITGSVHGPIFVWMATQIVATYMAIALVLVSLRVSGALVTVSMLLCFLSHRPLFSLMGVAFLVLSACSFGRREWILVVTGVPVAWITGVAMLGQTTINESSTMRPGAFWWLGMATVTIAALVGLGVRFLVIRTARIKAQLQDVEEAAEEARIAERHALARELHDVVAHHITVITMQAMAARNSKDMAKLQGALGVVEESSRQALTELRALLGVLRAEEREHREPGATSAASATDLASQLDSHVKQLQEHGIAVSEATIAENISKVPMSIQATCGRVLRESVTNILKYSLPGGACAIALKVDRGAVDIRISNDKLKRNGARNPSLSSGFGLTSLNERVRALGGIYCASRSGDEWVVSARIPIPSSD